jgi:hypothetical protein
MNVPYPPNYWTLFEKTMRNKYLPELMDEIVKVEDEAARLNRGN